MPLVPPWEPFSHRSVRLRTPCLVKVREALRALEGDRAPDTGSRVELRGVHRVSLP